MKIGEYIDTYFPTIDGVIMTVHNYAKAIHDDDEDDECYVATANGPLGYIDDKPYRIVRYASMDIPKRKGYRTGIPMVDAQFLFKQYQLEADLVHAHSPFAAGQEALRVARLKEIPLVASFHSKFYDDFYKATGSKLIAEKAVDVVVKYFDSADYVWTCNDATKATLQDYGYKGDILVMPNGAGYIPPKDIEKSNAYINDKYGIKDGEKVVLFVGQQIVQKNIPSIISACEAYSKMEDSKPFKLVLVGDGENKADFEKMVANSTISDKVIFTGKIDKMKLLNAIYTRADIFVFPSIYDNAPLVVREASAAKVPSILIEGSNAADGTTDGFNAYHCFNSVESIAATIKRAFEDDETRRQIGINASNTISVSWDVITEKVKTLYREIIRDYKK